MAQKIIQIQMRHLFYLKDLFSNRKGFVILTSLLRFKNKYREFRELDCNTLNVVAYKFVWVLWEPEGANLYFKVDIICVKNSHN